jgi:hypothetical protein
MDKVKSKIGVKSSLLILGICTLARIALCKKLFVVQGTAYLAWGDILFLSNLRMNLGFMLKLGPAVYPVIPNNSIIFEGAF